MDLVYVKGQHGSGVRKGDDMDLMYVKGRHGSSVRKGTTWI